MKGERGYGDKGREAGGADEAGANGLAAALGCGWGEAKALKDQISGRAPAAPRKEPGKKKPGGSRGVKETPPEPATDTWDVTLQLPTERLDDIFADFTAQEKAEAIGIVLQQRMDAVLAPA